MTKINFKRTKEVHTPSRNVSIEIVVNHTDGYETSAIASLKGDFWIKEKSRQEFIEKIGALINEYRV